MSSIPPLPNSNHSNSNSIANTINDSNFGHYIHHANRLKNYKNNYILKLKEKRIAAAKRLKQIQIENINSVYEYEVECANTQCKKALEEMNEACRVYLEAMNQFTSDTTMSSEVGVAMSKSNSAMEDVVVKKGKYVDKKNAAEETYKKEIKSEEEDSWNVIEEALQNEDTSILKQYANNTQSSLLNTQIQETQRTSQRTTRSKKTDDLVSSDTDSMQQMQASNKVKKNTNITATTNYLQQTNHVFYRYQLLQHQQRGLSASPKGTPLIVPSKQNSNSRKRNSNAISGSYGGGSVPNFFSKYMKIELDETECRADMLKIVDHMKMNAQSHGNSHQISNHILPNGKMDVAMKANAASMPLVDVMVTENHTLIIQREQYYHVGSHIHITYVVTNETMSNAMITVITPYEIIVKCVIGTRISIPINQIVHNRVVIRHM